MKPDPIDDFLRDTEPRFLLLAGIASALILLLAGLLFVVRPAWAEYSELRASFGQASETSLSTSAETDASIAALKVRVESLRTKLYGGAAGIPRRQIESFVVDLLDRLASHHDVDLLGITPDLPVTAWMFEELPYEVRVKGSYFSIHRWLYDVEKELRPMVIKQFQLSPTRADGAVVLDLRVVAYRAAEQNPT